MFLLSLKPLRPPDGSSFGFDLFPQIPRFGTGTFFRLQKSYRDAPRSGTRTRRLTARNALSSPEVSATAGARSPCAPALPRGSSRAFSRRERYFSGIAGRYADRVHTFLAATAPAIARSLAVRGADDPRERAYISRTRASEVWGRDMRASSLGRTLGTLRTRA